MFFDTHAHYDSEAFDDDRDALLTRLPSQGVSLILNPGCDEETSEMAVSYAEAYPYVYAAVGWHPHEANSMNGTGIDYLRRRAAHPKVAAIGEIGLDYHYDFAPRDVQRDVFERQLALAAELDLPVLIHDREAHADCLSIVKNFPGLRGVFHCYSGSRETARELYKLGFHISFTGVVTFKNARRSLEVVEEAPLDRLLLETDAPYMAPEPFRGKRSNSSMLRQIAEKIGDLRGLSYEEVAAITLRNGKALFGIGQQG